jgi:hypothetical protein
MFNVGDAVFIRTVTYHHVGRIKAKEEGWVILEDASWVADSGRFSTALEKGSLSEVEHTGTCAIALSAIVDVFPWTHDLPVATK